ncbi:hypothetical protein BTHI11S_00989 [Bosea thiooxidans]
MTALAGLPGERIAVRTIVAALQDRAYALLVVLLGLPNCLPMPPPIPLVCGLVLAFVGLQMLTGRRMPWLPQALLARSIGKPELSRAVDRALPALTRLERFSKPRLTMLHGAYAVPVLGLVILILALGLIVAAPFIGQIRSGWRSAWWGSAWSSATGSSSSSAPPSARWACCSAPASPTLSSAASTSCSSEGPPRARLVVSGGGEDFGEGIVEPQQAVDL